MLLIGMGGCTSFDVVTILKKARQSVVDCVAEIDAVRADEWEVELAHSLDSLMALEAMFMASASRSMKSWRFGFV